MELNNLVEGFLSVKALGRSDINISPLLSPNLTQCSGDYVLREELCNQLWLTAVEAMPEGGKIVWETSYACSPFSESAPGTDEPCYLPLAVKDTGTGMDQVTLNDVFDPFFTTKANKQRGLDLITVYETIQRHHGLVEVTFTVGEGITVDVFPPPLDATNNRPLLEKLAPESTHLTRVMVVDDEDMVRNMLKEILQELDFEVTAIASGEEAMSVYQQTDSNIVVVVLDLGLSGMSGIKTFRLLKSLGQNVKAIVFTGDPHQAAVPELVVKGVTGVVAKPFNPFDLRDMIVKGVF